MFYFIFNINMNNYNTNNVRLILTNDEENKEETQRENRTKLRRPYRINLENVNNYTDYVSIPRSTLNETINQLNQYKDFLVSHYNIPEGEINPTGENLNIESLCVIIKTIWTNFMGDFIVEDFDINLFDYVDAIYRNYNNDIRYTNNHFVYVHPLFFPKIFELVFTENRIPFSIQENNILTELNLSNVNISDYTRYNQEVEKHNVLKYFRINNEEPVPTNKLYIYRNIHIINNKISAKRTTELQIKVDGIKTIVQKIKNQTKTNIP